MHRSKCTSVWRRAGRWASARQVGLVLLVTVIAYLAAASMAEARAAAPTGVLPAPPGMFSHWTLWMLTAAFCVNLILVTVVRIPLRWSNAGAWCSHAGLVVLACAGGWYALAHVRGHCVAVRTSEGWSEIRHFYQADRLAVLAGSGEEPLEHQTPLGSLGGARSPVDLDVPVPCGTEGVEIRAVRFYPRGLPHEQCGGGSLLAGVPALHLRVAAGHWQQDHYVPFLPLAIRGLAHCVELPGGRRVFMSFSRFRRPLGAAVRIRSVRYETFPASEMPKDYICQLEITAAGRTRAEMLRLNAPVMVGRYRVFQGPWSPTGKDPQQIFLVVGSRPGLWLVWLGCAMVCLGLPYAFYVKPLIVRRGAQR